MVGVVGKESVGESEQFENPRVGDPVEHPPLAAFGCDEAAPAQAGEMVGDLGLWDREPLGELADGEFALAAEQLEDAQPGRVAEAAEVLGDEVALGRRLGQPEGGWRACGHIREDKYQNWGIFWDTPLIGAVPFTIALTAGGLSVLNPCGFPLLPAFLSFYLGAEEERLPSAPTRILQGLLVGALVTTGFLGLFAVVALPVSFGVGAVADAVDWVGLATGIGLTLAGAAALTGRTPHLRPLTVVRPRRERRLGAMLLFGVCYGAASLGCTLPILLALIGASLGAEKLAVFAAYGAGMAVVLTALAVAVALTREGLARRLRPLLAHVNLLAALLLFASGGYLTYYWARIRFGNQLTLADDPIVGTASRYAAQLEIFARRHDTPLLAVAATIVALALAAGALQLLRHRTPRAGELAQR